MKKQSCPWPVAVALALGLALSSCGLEEPASGDTPSRADKKKDRKHKVAAAKKRQAAAGKAPVKKATAAAKPKPKPDPKPKSAATPQRKTAPKLVWVCSWSPTFDDDRHNDVECANGIATERPYLREWDDFVKRWEIMESARSYARQRSAG